MTQEPPNPPPTRSQSSPPPLQQSPPATTRLGLLTKKVAINIVEVLDQLLWALDRILWIVMGKLGRTVYVSIQEAIALSIILTIPGLIYKLILGKDFSGYHACMLENALDTSWLACYVIVTFKDLFWLLIFGRFIGRIVTYIKDYWQEFKDAMDS